MKKIRLYKLFLIGLSVVIAITSIVFMFVFVNHMPRGELRILNCDGQEMAKYDCNTASLILKDKNYADYIDNVIKETSITLSIEEERLLNSKVIITTYFDDRIFKIVENRLNKVNYDDQKSVEIAIVSTNGKLLTSIAREKEGYVNLEPHKAGSAIKPLSVYAPALENDLINWATTINDSPVKVIKENNKTRDWPANYDGIYSNKDVSLKYAIKHSLNTTSVQVLDMLTPKLSCEFLGELNIDVSYENEYANSSLYEEIYGNLALGELKKGVTTENLATAYQIFANGGKFTKGTSVREISCEGKVIYNDELFPTEILDEANAKIMNLLLQSTVEDGGTAEKAKIENLKIAGKTGTSQGCKDNWFVGMSPDYVCAVWYGYDHEMESRSENISISIFKDVFLQLKHKTVDYPHSDLLIERKYCIYTGKIATDSCNETDTGYFNINKTPQKCTKH